MDSLKDKTAKGLFWGGFSNTLQQVASMFFGIVLARILSSHDYGLFSMLLIFTSLANLLQDSGFTTALINKKDATDEDYNSVFWFSCSMGAGLYVLFFLAAPWIAEFYGAPELTAGARVLFLWFLFGCTGTVHNAILIKRLMMKEKTRADLTAFIVSCVVAVTMALCGMAYWSLIVQMVVQGAVSVLLRWHYSPWRPSFRFPKAPIRRMLPFSSKLLITGLFNVVNDNIFTLILGIRYSKAQAGYYSQGRKWGYMAYSSLWGMMSNVSQSVLAQVADTPGRQQAVFRKLVGFMAYVTCPCMLGLAFVAPELTTITVTDKWAASVPYMQLFCLWGIIAPLNNLCTNTLLSRGHSGVYMYGTIALDVVQLLVIYFSAPLGIYQMVINYVVVNFAWFFVWFYFIRRSIPVSLAGLLFRDLLPYAALTLAAIGMVHLVVAPLGNVYLRFGCKIAFVALLYVGTLHVLRSEMLRETLGYLRKLKGGGRR